LAAETLRRLSLHRKAGIRRKAKLFWGDTMDVVFPEPMSNYLFRYGVCEEDMTAMLLTVLKPGMVFVDIGAHFGYATLLGARLVAAEGRVFSFEPTPSSFKLLQRNTAKSKNVSIHNMAIHSCSGTLPFNDFGLRYSTRNSFFGARTADPKDNLAVQAVTAVAAMPLDRYLAERQIVPDVVKIDAESAEHDILIGMSETIDRRHPVIVMEVGDLSVPRAASSRELVQFLIDRQYAVFNYVDSQLRKQGMEVTYAPGNRLFVPIMGDHGKRFE
jgi:FkbM family methyltransferase